MILGREGAVLEKSELNANYNPSDEIKDFTNAVKNDYQTGWDIQHRAYTELNDKTPLERAEIDQKRFNTYVPPKSEDHEESWRYNGSRGTTRAKIIGMAAQATASVMIPNFFAQNDQDEEDVLASQLAKDLVEWNLEQTDYEVTNVFGVVAALVNPCSYMGVEFEEAMQRVKVQLDNGDITTKEVIDEVMSGLNVSVIPFDEMFIANAYEYQHQKQRFIVRRKYIDYTTAENKYWQHPNWEFVEPGVNVLYSEEDRTFYNDRDEENPTECEEVTVQYRNSDTEVVFVNGIYLGEETNGKDPTDVNMFTHRRLTSDIDGTPISIPIYPHTKFGFEPIDEKRFYYYKSAVNKMGSDQDYIDKLWAWTMDGTLLSTYKPIVTSGGGDVDSSIVYPGGVTSYDEDVKITPVDVVGNLTGNYNALGELERSIDQSSQSDLRSGQSPSGSNTAFEISRIEQNARINFSMFGKIYAQAVVDIGRLALDSILLHETTPIINEIAGGKTTIKYRQFLLPDKTEGGKKVTKHIKFTDRFMGKEMSDDDIKKHERRLFNESGGMDSDRVLTEVNPYLFARMKFMTRVQAEDFFPKNEAFEKAFNLEAYDRMIANPYVDPQAVTRDYLVETFADGDTDKYMAKEPQLNNVVGKPQQGQTSNLVNQVTGDNSLNNLIAQ